MGPLRPIRLWRGRRSWLRDPAAAIRLLGGDFDALDAESLSIRGWLALTYERDEQGAEAAARAALAKPAGDTRFASATIAEIHMRRGEADEAIAAIEAARTRLPGIKWYSLTLADLLE